MHQGDEARACQLRLPAVGDGDLGGAFHVETAVVGGEGMAGQALDGAAGLDPADHRAPTELLEAPVDVHGQCVGRVGPHVVAVIAAVGALLEMEFVHRIGARSVGKPRQEAGHGQAHVARVVGVAQAVPRDVLEISGDLGQVARIGQFLPALHLQRGWRRTRQERSVRRGAHPRHRAQQIHVGCAVVEVVVRHHAAVGLAAELPVFVLVQALEQRALIPGDAL